MIDVDDDLLLLFFVLADVSSAVVCSINLVECVALTDDVGECDCKVDEVFVG